MRQDSPGGGSNERGRALDNHFVLSGPIYLLLQRFQDTGHTDSIFNQVIRTIGEC